MMPRHDPLADPEPLIRRIYAFAAYRVGDGPEAEDVTSATFERALRYRDRYDPRQGKPISWLLGIARRCVADSLRMHSEVPTADDRLHALCERTPQPALDEAAVRRLAVRHAVAGLSDHDRELIALRYGADLSVRQVAAVVGAQTNATEVALHRARERLRRVLAEEGGSVSRQGSAPAAQGRLEAAPELPFSM